MFVKNIVKISAEYLGLKDIVQYLNSEIEETEEILSEINNFILAVNMVNNNIASSYIELLNKCEIYQCDKVIEFSKISDKTIIEIKSVKSFDGFNVDYKILSNGVEVKGCNSCVIEYSYFPDKVNIDDKINQYLKINDMVFALGVVGEYLYIKGAIDDAYMWDKRFKSSMFNLLRPKRNVILPKRRWE